MRFIGLPVVLWTFVLFCVATRVAGSSIPMWEFLSRDEKMSHLYKVFSKQVARYCISSPRPDCNKNLLVSGVRSLANMDDNLLDKLDPYQHGATEMIWRAMVGTHRFSSRVGYETEDTYYANGADSLATSDSDTNGLTEDSGNDYARPSKHTGPYLVGPMVIRVYPDGRPVPEDTARPLPKDEDAEELKYVRLPSIKEIEANSHASLYGKSSRVSPKRPYLTANEKNHQRRTILPLRDSTRHRVNPIPYERRRFARITSNDGAIRYY